MPFVRYDDNRDEWTALLGEYRIKYDTDIESLQDCIISLDKSLKEEKSRYAAKFEDHIASFVTLKLDYEKKYCISSYFVIIQYFKFLVMLIIIFIGNVYV